MIFDDMIATGRACKLRSFELPKVRAGIFAAPINDGCIIIIKVRSERKAVEEGMKDRFISQISREYEGIEVM